VVAADWVAMMDSVGGEFIVRATGEIDFAGAQRFREYLLGAVWMAQGGVHVDLRGVQYLDSSGLHALAAAYDAARRRAVRFGVEADGVPRKVIELAGLTYLLREFDEPPAPLALAADPELTYLQTSMPLVTRVHDDGDVQVVSVSGHSDMAGGDAFSSTLAAATRDGTRPVVVDLSELQWINSFAAGVIALAKSDASTRGIVFEIRNPNPIVRRVLEICGVIDSPT
jgi:anti-sigma B factor antagonist